MAIVGILARLRLLGVAWLIASGIRVVQEYERGVIFVFGRCRGAKGPGIFIVPPFISRIVRVNLQTQAVPVASQQVITKDNVTVGVDAVGVFPGQGPGRVGDQDPELVQRRTAGRADVVALDHRAPRARPAARRARPDQPGAEDRARPADRAVGRRSRDGRDPRRRAAGTDAAGDGASGRGRARTPGQDHRRRGRDAGFAEASARPRR